MKSLCQVPLKELVVCHSSQEYLDDVQSLAGYVSEELNIREVVCTTDEERCGVRWKLVADFGVLGRKLRKDMPKVRNGLSGVSSADAKSYLESGHITVAGVELGPGDLTSSRYVELPEQSDNGAKYDSNTDRDVVVLVDTLVREDFIAESLARELVNRVQKARKEAKLLATDDIDVYISSEDQKSLEALSELCKTKEEVIVKTLKRLPQQLESMPAGSAVFWESSKEAPVEIGEHKAWFTFVKH